MMIAFVAVLMISLGIRSFIRAFAFQNMVKGAGKNGKSRCP